VEKLMRKVKQKWIKTEAKNRRKKQANKKSLNQAMSA
jgi:hypothetical protein